MASRDIIAGISISDNTVSLAVLEHRPEEIELLFLDERERAGDGEYWFIDPLEQYLQKSHTKVHQVAIALDTAALVVLTCPMDKSLTQPERNEQVHWELSHFIKNYQPREYINDVHILDAPAEGNVEYALAVAVRRSLLFGLQEHLKSRRLALGIVDVNHFAAENTVLRSHPEFDKGTFACLGFSESRVDASVMRHGHLARYRYQIVETVHGSRSFLTEVLSERGLEGVFLYGTGFSRDHEKIARSLVKCPVAVLNPFRRIIISRNFPYFPHYIPKTHRFASAVGIALRRS